MFKSILLSLFPLLILLMGCQNPPEKQSKTPSVLVSIPPYVHFIKKIAGDTLAVHSLVPAGSSPHTYEPSPKQIQNVREAALWISIGEPSEKKIVEIFQEQNPKTVIVDLSKHLPLLSSKKLCGSCPHHHESFDLHFWLSPKLAKKQAELIAQQLIKLFPDNEQIYKKNLDDFLEELSSLDQEISQILEHQKGKAILASHPAFGYFCSDYHLIQLSVETEGKDPLPQEASRTMEEAQKLQVKSVLLQSQYNNKGSELIAKNLHLPTHMIDPYSENYVENLRNLAHIIAGK